MSLVPAFELGLWNAWIFIVPALLATIFCIHLMTKKGAPGGTVRSPRVSKTTLLFANLSKLIYLPATIYSGFLPLKIGTSWFYVGLPITLVGLVGTIIVLVDWIKTPAGEPVTRGIYRYSRHPQYVMGVLLFLGVTIISASWVFLLFTIIVGVGVSRPYFIKIEEAQCLGHYGATYREYMKRTPRWIGIPKSRKNG
jgi:protein-S-isoprenylcysteine O-methyltransferase Ste14